MDYSIGSEAWIVPGFAASSLIAIKVRLEGMCPGGYYVDEPIDKCFPNDELYSRAEAYAVLRQRMVDYYAQAKYSDNPEDYELARKTKSSLFRFRIYQLNLARYLCEENSVKRHPTYPLTDKRKDKDWFIIEDIAEREVDALVSYTYNDDRLSSNG